MMTAVPAETDRQAKIEACTAALLGAGLTEEAIEADLKRRRALVKLELEGIVTEREAERIGKRIRKAK
jgi:hypothetical protein